MGVNPGAYLVIQTESQFGHSREKDFHLDGADNFTSQNVAVGRHQQIHGFWWQIVKINTRLLTQEHATRTPKMVVFRRKAIWTASFPLPSRKRQKLSCIRPCIGFLQTNTPPNKQTDDVEKDFVFSVLDSFRAPTDGIGDGHWRPGSYVQLVTLLSNELLKDLAVCWWRRYKGCKGWGRPPSTGLDRDNRGKIGA